MKTYISYSDAIHLLDNIFIDIPLQLVDNYEPHLLLNFNEEDTEYFQVLLSNIKDEQYVKILTDLFPDVHLKFFELLNGWCLFVQHTGTAWRCVDIEVNTNSIYFKKLFHKDGLNYKHLKFI